LGALALLSVIIYELGANLALRRTLEAFAQGELSTSYDSAYTLIPGRIVVHRLRIRRSAEPAWSMTAERLELRLALADFFQGRARIRHARATSITALAPQKAAVALHADDSGINALSAISLGSGTRKERGQSLWVALLTGSAHHIEIAGLKLERGAQLEVRGLSASGAALQMASANLRLRETALEYDGAALGVVPRGNIGLKACGWASAELRGVTCGVALQAKLVPAAGLGLTSAESIEVDGQLAIGRGNHGKVAMTTPRVVTLRAGGRSWDLPRGFSAQLALSRDGKVSGRVSAPELGTSDRAAPGFHIEALTIDLDSRSELASEAVADPWRHFRVRFRLERAVLACEERVFRSPLRGALLLERATRPPRAWTIRSGTLDLSSLDLESSQLPRQVAPLSVRLRVDAGLVSFPAVALQGKLEVSGTELDSLLKLFGLPESIGLMLSRVQHRPFELKADARRGPTELWLRNLVLVSGDVRMEGALELSGAARHGALLIATGRSALGVQFGDRGARVTLRADRAWLREQLGRGVDR